MEDTSQKKQRQTVDRRVVKTRRALIDALAVLLRDMELSAVTISKLVEVSDVNRKTFYAHYGSISDVFAELENDTLNKFAGACDCLDFSIGDHGIYPMMRKMLQIISDDKEFYSYVFKSPGFNHIIIQTKNLLKEKFAGETAKYYSLDRTILECMTEFISAGIIATLRHWLDTENSLSVETLSLMMSDFISAGMGLLLSSYK